MIDQQSSRNIRNFLFSQKFLGGLFLFFKLEAGKFHPEISQNFFGKNIRCFFETMKTIQKIEITVVF